MKTRHVYLVLCGVGLILPYTQFLPWLVEHGFDLALFVRELFATRIGAFFGMDVIASAFTLFYFMHLERQRLGALRHLWLPVVSVFAVGVSLGLPLFLYLRQRHLDGVGPSSTPRA